MRAHSPAALLLMNRVSRVRSASQVQGALKLACQHHAAHHPGVYKAVAVVVQGGPVSRVEAHCMDEIVGGVKVFGEAGVPTLCDIAVQRYTQAELFEEWAPFVSPATVPAPHHNKPHGAGITEEPTGPPPPLTD